ncbi:MAG: electron transport complex subunit RsxC [Bacteroidota bacterium]|nr:electron transport complex subunit RsxC [Bacteroidota bacterium]
MRTFKMGGIHPQEYKLSAGIKIQDADLPRQAVIPLGHYLGIPSNAVIAKGDTIKVGQLIGQAGGHVSANVHSSVSGIVNRIEGAFDASGYKVPSVFIDVEGDEWLESIDRTREVKRECTLTPAGIIKKITESGIVGLGGATFPTHVKLTPPPGKKAEVLIVNGVECEPYLTCDHQLMLEKGEEILVGVTILMKAIDVNRAVIGIENNKKDAIALMQRLAKTFEGIQVVPLQVQYPQGGEKQLVDAILGRQVPSGALPIEVGAVVQNVATAFAVYEAVQKNKPLFERVITITGKSMAHHGNYRARIGTPLISVVEQAGGIPEDTGKIVAGGPMMGRALSNLDIAVAKGTSGVLFIPTVESARKQMQNCIRCTKCVVVCPMGLEPYLLMTQSERSMWKEMENERIMDCIECGCCSFTCPSNRPLLDYLRLGKTTVNKIIRNRHARK